MLVGRQVELRRLAELVDRIRVGNGGAVLVEGEAGIGKTSLLDALVASVDDDVQVVRMVGRESEAEFSYGALRDVWKGFDAANPTGEPYAVARATLTALADRAKQNPLLVIIDDLHWIDRSSVQALLFAARRIERDRVAIIGAFRPHVGHPIDTSGLDRITLEGLDAASAATLLTTDYPDLAASVVGEIIERTSGNPLAMREVARALHPRQRSAARPIGDVLPVGSEIYRRVRRRMRDLSADAQTAVLVVAADPTRHRGVVEAACSVLGIEEADVSEGFAAEFIVVEAIRIDFTHPLARSAVYGGASMSDRRRVHRALAAVSNDREQQVWHRAAAVRVADESVATELEQLAMAAMGRGDLSGAAHAWERAALVGGPGDARAGRYLAAAAAASQCGLTVDPLVAGVLEATTDDALRADAHIIQAMAYGWQGRHNELALLAEKEVPLLADVDPLRAAILLSVSVTDQWYQLKTAAAGGQAAEAWALAGRRLHDTHPFGVAPGVFTCFVSAVTDGFDDALFEACREVVFDGRGLELATPLVWSYVALERLDDALDFIDRAIALSRSTGVAPGLAWLLTLSTAVALRCGDLSRAAADGAEALSLAPHTAGPFAAAYAAGHAALLSFYQGRYDDAIKSAAQSIASGDAMGSPVCAVIARVAVALTEHRESPLARVEALDAIWTALIADGLQSPGYFFVAGSLLDACVDAGDRERADVVMATIEAFPAVNVGPYTRALIARTRAIFSGAASDFERALALHGAIDDRLEEARTRLAYADLLRRKRQRTAARREIDVALATLRSIGATHFVTIAETRLAALDERRHITVAPAVTLSPQEYRVATEVAAGLSNREIAARLFLSVKSVEWHLTRIYRKLGVTSRAKLVAYINREGLPPVSPE